MVTAKPDLDCLVPLNWVAANCFLDACRQQAASGILTLDFIKGMQKFSGMRQMGSLRNHISMAGGYKAVRTTEKEINGLEQIAAISNRKQQKAAYNRLRIALGKRPFISGAQRMKTVVAAAALYVPRL